jgi:hypothetical protein
LEVNPPSIAFQQKVRCRDDRVLSSLASALITVAVFIAMSSAAAQSPQPQRTSVHVQAQIQKSAELQRQALQNLTDHSGRGSQYASGDYRRALRTHGIVCSMSRRGNCWDKAVAESFFATVKVELAHDADWMTRAQARGEVFEYLERFYNGQRRHSALDYQSPVTFERQWATACGTTAAARVAAHRGVVR